MAQFEYVTTLASFIVAFGVARLLAGWVRQYLECNETPVYPLQVAVSALLLVSLLQNAWSMWIAHDIVWTFGTFSLLIVSNLALVGACSLIHPPVTHSGSTQEYYFGVRRAVFGLSAVWIVIGASMDWILVSSLPIELPLGIMYNFRLLALCLFVFLMWSPRPSHHWFGFAVAVTLQVGWILAVSYDPLVFQ